MTDHEKDARAPTGKGTDPEKGSPAKGAHRIGDDGGDRQPGSGTGDTPADPGFATNGE